MYKSNVSMVFSCSWWERPMLFTKKQQGEKKYGKKNWKRPENRIIETCLSAWQSFQLMFYLKIVCIKKMKNHEIKLKILIHGFIYNT